MDRDEYLKLHAVEERMWWFQGIHDNLLAMLARFVAAAGGPARILDAGCGTGGFLRRLKSAAPDAVILGLDFDAGALALAASKSAVPLCAGSVNELPFASGSLNAIFSADVLCHHGVDEMKALGSFHRCLADGGMLVLNLPAYEWMISSHDRAVHNVRRYSRGRVKGLLRAAGFAPVHASYWNTILFPLVVVRRKLWATQGASSDVMPFPPALEFIFRSAMRIENFFIRRGIALPFGGSVLAVAIKHG